MPRSSTTFSAPSSLCSNCMPPRRTTDFIRWTNSCTSNFWHTRLTKSRFTLIPSTDTPSSVARALNASTLNFPAWLRSQPDPFTSRPCCSSLSFSDISGWSQKVTTYSGRAKIAILNQNSTHQTCSDCPALHATCPCTTQKIRTNTRSHSSIQTHLSESGALWQDTIAVSSEPSWLLQLTLLWNNPKKAFALLRLEMPLSNVYQSEPAGMLRVTGT